jgi:YfiH family protein
VQVVASFTNRVAAGATSTAPYDAWNLGDHVGDDPAAVAANRALLATRLAVEPDHVVFMNQVHGNAVAVVDGPTDLMTGPPTADALVTATPGLALAVLVADCVPLLLVDPASGIRAAVHAGRKGVQLGVVAAAVQALRDLGADELWGRLGPCIGPCCYAVGADVQDEVVAVVPETKAVTHAGAPSLDLRAGVVAQLAAAGIVSVSADATCTAEDPRCYSYRRDGVTGRMAGVVLAG